MNRISPDEVLTTPAGELAALASESLFQLKNDAADLLAMAKAIDQHVDRALDLKYADRAHQLRLAAGKDTGVVHFDDGHVRITADLPKKVDWDQKRLAEITRRIAAIRAGIEYNAIGQRVAYWMYRAHPGDGPSPALGFNDLVRVPAEQVLHIYEPLRAGQLRGVPVLAPVLARLKSLDDFDDAVLFRQEVANLFAGFIRKPAPEDPPVDPVTGAPIQTDADGFTPMVGLEPGTLQELLPGEEVDFSNPPDAGNTYPDFMRQQLLATAAGAGLPFELLTGDLRNVNDRVIRVVLNEFRRRIEQRQFGVFVHQMCRPVRAAWLDMAVLAGAIALPDYPRQRRAYAAMMQEAIGKGWSTMESSFVLARAYIEQADPQRAQQVSAAAQRIGEERDPARQQAMLQAFEATMKTGDLFADMQVKAALTAYMQNADLYQRLKQNAARASGEIEQDLTARRETSKQIWSEVTQAWDEALRRIGDALRPVTDTVGQALGSVGRALATLVAQAPMVVAGLATVAGGLVALKGARAAWNIGRGALDLAWGTLLAGRSGRASGMPGLPGKLGNLASVLTGGAAAGAQPVFVTNWPGVGALPDLLGRSGQGAGRPSGSTAGDMARAGGTLGRVGGWLGKAGGRLGGALAIGSAAYQVFDTAKNATTREEKAQGYSGAAGTLAGGLAGAKLGAAVGALGGPIGIAIGGLLGGAIGSVSGDKLGGWLGKSLVTSQSPKASPTLAATLVPPNLAPPVAAGAALPVPKAATTPVAKAPAVPQQVNFSPTLQITVKGDVKDPRQLANELMPHLKRLFEQFQQQNQRAAWFDGAHV